MQRFIRSLITPLLSLSLCIANAHAAQTTSNLTTDAIINLPRADAWALFTSEAGLKSLGYSQATVELHLGGTLQASGTAALPGLNSEVISLDVEHMLSFKPAVDASHTQWTVLYFTAMGKDMTQLRWLEYFAEPQRAAVEQHQAQVRGLFDQLIRRYAPECEVCKLEKARGK
jgi:hypothetical protein